MPAPDHACVYEQPARTYRLLFDCGRVMDITTVHDDSSTLRGWALDEAERVWGRNKDRRIVGVTTLRTFPQIPGQPQLPLYTTAAEPQGDPCQPPTLSAGTSSTTPAPGTSPPPGPPGSSASDTPAPGPSSTKASSGRARRTPAPAPS